MSIRLPDIKLRPIAGAVLAVGTLFIVTGCDLQENADKERGRQLFGQKCGTCHALAEAGTAADIGPNLDDAFKVARANGTDSDTIEGIVESQIEFPRPAPPDATDVYMPADLVEGQDAADVAAYVASVAGIPGIKPPQLPPDQLFTEQCGICHTLQAAMTTATTGPDLDEALPGMTPDQIMESIVEPDTDIAPGFQPGVMPASFGDTIPPEDLQKLVDYLVQSTGGGGGGGGK